MQLHNVTKAETLCADCRPMRGWGSLRGLMLRGSIPGDGMLLDLGKAGGVHTWLMLFPIDVALLDENLRVLWAGTLPPWRRSPTDRLARYALELPLGTLAKTRTQVGDLLSEAFPPADQPSADPPAADLHHLARAIGPRPAGSGAEARAADYIRARLEAMGLQPAIREFRTSRRSWPAAWFPLFLGMWGLPLAWLPHPWDSLGGLSWLAAGWLTLRGAKLTLRLPPYGRSRNVSALIPPVGERRFGVVLAAHLDTAPAHQGGGGEPAWLPRVAAAIFAMVGLLVAVPPVGVRTAVWVLLGLMTVSAWFLLRGQEKGLPVPGASDDASGLAVLLDVARRLVEKPLGGLGVTILATGAEEVGCQGMREFLSCRRERPDLVVALDDLGSGDAHVLPAGKRGLPYAETAGRAGIPRGKLRAAAGSDADAAAMRGIPAILVAGLEPGGKLPARHHSLADLPEYVDVPGLERVAARVEGFLRLLDREV